MNPNLKNVKVEIEIAKKRFESAIEFLKTKSLNEKQTFFDLPWYFVLSTPNSGKNALFKQAQLDFILQRKNEKNSLRHCDWWATKEILLIDVNPDYTSPSASKMAHLLWQNFINTITQIKKKSIHGLWLIIDLPTLLEADQQPTKLLVKQFKHRIKEIEKKFNTHFPVYIMISHMESLAGFIEYFDDLPANTRQQPWGMHFSAEQTFNRQRLADTFETSFNDILVRLNQKLVTRLHQERGLDNRIKIKDFPLQMESVKKPLTVFLQALSETLTGEKHPLRGLYFVSAGPKAIAIDRLIKPLTQTFSLATTYNSSSLPATEDYFVKHLFTQAILPDSSEYRLLKQKKTLLAYVRPQLMVILSAATLVLGFLSFLSYDFIRQTTHLSLAQETISQYSDLLQNNKLDANVRFTALHKLELANKTLHYSQFSLLSFLSISHVGKISKNVSLAYQNALEKNYLSILENNLIQQTQAQNPDISDLYSALEIYLMLGDKNHFDSAKIINWFDHHLNTQDGVNISEANHYLAAFMEQLPATIPLNPEIIANARKVLARTNTPALIQAILVSDNNEKDLKLSLPENLFAASYKLSLIPGMYTQPAFEQIYNTTIIEIAHALENGNWVLGSNKSDASNEEILNIVREQYIQNYIYTWNNLLTHLNLKPITSLKDVIAVWQEINLPDSKLTELMKTIYENTNVSYRNAATPISLYFNKLDSFIYQNRKQVHQNISIIINDLQGVASAKNIPIAAFQLAKAQTMIPQEADVFSQMYSYATTQAPTPINQWLVSLLNDSWQLLLDQAAITINAAWQEQVLSYFTQHLGPYYPFSALAKQEASLEEVSKFFAKNGHVSKFYNSYLANFIEDKDGALIGKDFFGAHLNFQAQTLPLLNQLMQIENSFLTDEKPIELKFDFIFAPTALSANIKKLNLNFDNQTVSYTQGNLEPMQFTWPGDTAMHFANLVITDQANTQQIVTATGNWAIFRLIDKAHQLNQKDTQTLEANWSLPPFDIKFALVSQQQMNPFLPGLIEGLTLPNDLFKSADLL